MNIKQKEIKCVVWDLDHTLWDGILLEDKEVRLKPGIREIICELDARGILHSIASRNHYDDAMEKLRQFGLDTYFLYPEIHWNAKSVSVRRIIDHLNIGADTIMFIDDQPFELDEVKNEIPEVDCMHADEYHSLLSHPRLNPRFVTEDSKRRRLMYLEDMKRQEDESRYEGPTEQFLSSLQMEFTIFEAEEDDLARAEELTVRTNQLNATGITYSYDELSCFRQDGRHKLYMCELVDKYGSYGKIGLALVEIADSGCWHLKLLLMSCRVVSRGVGTIFLSYIMNMAKQHGNKLYADFRLTGRNKQMYVAYRFANFTEESEGEGGNKLLVNELSFIPPYPHFVKIIVKQPEHQVKG